MSMRRTVLLGEVDRRQKKPVTGGRVEWIALAHGGWKVVLPGVELGPGEGCARDGWDALEDVLHANPLASLDRLLEERKGGTR